MWSLTSPLARRISGPRKFCSSPKNYFFNTIGTFTTWRSCLKMSVDRGEAEIICSFRVFRFLVESRCDAVALGRACVLPPLSSGGALVARPLLRFHIPLIEPDMQISSIRLSDRTSRLHPRRAAATLGQTYETEVPVEMREWISPASTSPDLVF